MGMWERLFLVLKSEGFSAAEGVAPLCSPLCFDEFPPCWLMVFMQLLFTVSRRTDPVYPPKIEKRGKRGREERE